MCHFRVFRLRGLVPFLPELSAMKGPAGELISPGEISRREMMSTSPFPASPKNDRRLLPTSSLGSPGPASSFGGKWPFSVSILMTVFSSVVYQNFCLHSQVDELQGSLLNQIAIANESLGGGIVVVMAEQDKEEIELDIGKMEFDFKGTSVICRSGSPLILADLKKVSVSKARAIIVLAEDGNADQIWEYILGFENCEFYIKRWPQLEGMHFEDELISYPDAIPCGVKVASLGGRVILNPDDLCSRRRR